MGTTISRHGFAQVEPNHLAGIVTGQIYAQLPVDTSTTESVGLGTIIENGRFAKYDYAAGKVDLKGTGQWMLIYNEEKLYDPAKSGHKDFAMQAENYDGGEIVPRLIATVVGDIFTTNAFGASTGLNTPITNKTPDVAGIELDVSDKVAINKKTGYLDKVGGDADTDLDKAGPTFEVVKIYNLADGQPAVKLMRVS